MKSTAGSCATMIVLKRMHLLIKIMIIKDDAHKISPYEKKSSLTLSLLFISRCFSHLSEIAL